MNIDWIRECCFIYPGVTEEVQWESSLLFKVGGKIFVIASLAAGSENLLSLKVDPEEFDELIEIQGVIPAPYLAKNKWIAVKRLSQIKSSKLKELIDTSYRLVFDKLPRKTKDEILKSK